MTEEQLKMDYKKCLSLPRGKERMDTFQDLIRRADLIKAHSLSKYFRWMYSSELMEYGDQGKVFPLVAEYIALRETEKQWTPPDGEDGLVFMVDYCMEVLCYLPQIPLKQAEQIIAKFDKMILYNRFGRRLFYQRLFRFYGDIDTLKALEYLKKFKSTRRDLFSDCRACEQADMVRLFFRMGDMATAENLARPIFDGLMKCHDVPRNIWLLYLQRALDYKELSKASSLAESLYATSTLGDPSDLGYFGAILRCWTFTAPKKATKLFKRYLIHWEVLWDKQKWFSFIVGAWVYCKVQKAHIKTLKLELPSHCPFWKETNIYDLAQLEDWFYLQAVDIANKFDARNGTNRYTLALNRAKFSINYKEGEKFWLV